MNRKRNVSYIKPEDPEFLKVFKKQAGYDDRNHKFDELENADEDFTEDGDSEQPQVVVLKVGDLTAEEAEVEKKKIVELEAVTKADLTQRVVFKSKKKKIINKSNNDAKRKCNVQSNSKTKNKKSCQLLSFDDEDDDEEED